MASVVGNLKIIIGGDTADLDKSLKGAESSLASLGNAAKVGLAAIAVAAAAAGTALAVSMKHVIDGADELNKMSQSAGISVEELSKLKYAGELSDVSMEALGKSVGKLSRAMTEAASDGASTAAQAFTAMGISVKNQDGTLRESSDVLKDIADKFEGYKDGASKTALAIQIFGKAGAEMIPLLNSGRDGLEEMGDEAQKFGLVLDKRTTMAAEAFNDNLTRMGKIKEGLITTITAKMLPALEQLSESFLDSRKNTEWFNAVAEKLATVMNSLVTVGMTLITTWQQIFVTIGSLREAMGQLASGEVSKAFDTMRNSSLQTAQAFGELKSSLTQMWQASKDGDPTATWGGQTMALKNLSKEVEIYGATWSKTEAPVIASTTAQKDALDKFLISQAKATAGRQAEADSIGKTVGEQEKLKIAYQAEAIALAANIPLTDQRRAAITAAGDAAALAAMKVAGAQAAVTAMNPTQQFEFQMTQLQQLYDAGVITLDTFNERQKQIAESMGATWSQAGASMAGSFAQIAGAFGKESSAMATAAKVFGVIQGTISMYTGAAKALELPFPANIAAMAAVLAQGARLVASIKSQQVPTGFMTGGSMMVTGSGGADSVPVQFMASPGEQIDVWRPNEGGGADPRRGAGGQSVNLAIPAVTTRDAVAQIIDHMNEMFRDGYKLNVVAA
ncbi:hypothetical protein [Bradyrhizobium sp. SZCCHNS3002]|uniref:hypothetical protein n=1 Tax=Bradyrhizobium sp. SZCCHNS3002 TaxID=3057310 RepID=UPI0028EEA08A|nr:hypothetical protein [Bradyrhizobium sp. SZCCHNS3002]